MQRQTDGKMAERQTDPNTDRWRDRQMDTHRQTDGPTDIQRDRLTYGQPERQTDSLKDR